MQYSAAQQKQKKKVEGRVTQLHENRWSAVCIPLQRERVLKFCQSGWPFKVAWNITVQTSLDYSYMYVDYS